MYASLRTATWKVSDFDVSFETKRSDDITYARRVLTATVMTQVDAWDAMQFGDAFTYAPSHWEDLKAFVGDSSDPTSQREHMTVFKGVWYVSRIQGRIEAGVCELSMTIWQYTSGWTVISGSDEE